MCSHLFSAQAGGDKAGRCISSHNGLQLQRLKNIMPSDMKQLKVLEEEVHIHAFQEGQQWTELSELYIFYSSLILI